MRICVLKVGSSFSWSLFPLALDGGVASGKSCVPRDFCQVVTLCGQSGRMSSGMLAFLEMCGIHCQLGSILESISVYGERGGDIGWDWREGYPRCCSEGAT